jgi:hypothetical protein
MILSHIKQLNIVGLFVSSVLTIGFFSTIFPFQCYMILFILVLGEVMGCVREMLKYQQAVNPRLLSALWFAFILLTVVLFFIGVKIYIG